jgi:hypothetical protein
MRTWLAAASIALTVAAPAFGAQQECDPRSLVLACATASTPSNASFIDLMSEGIQAAESPAMPFGSDPATDNAANAPEAVSRPAVYIGARSAAGVPAVSALNPSGGALSGAAVPGWLGLSALATQPAPSFAWMLALGFLGVIVLRRARPFGY